MWDGTGVALNKRRQKVTTTEQKKKKKRNKIDRVNLQRTPFDQVSLAMVASVRRITMRTQGKRSVRIVDKERRERERER